MNLQYRNNTVCSNKKNHLPIIVLTDNFYLYLAISELFSQSKVIHVKIADEELSVKLKDELSSVVLIIDNDIFMQGEWYSILSVIDVCDLDKIIWLQGEKTGDFIPLKHGKNYLLKKNKKLEGFRKDLSDIIYGRELSVRNIKRKNLTRRELYIIKYFAAEHSLQSISEHVSLSIKSIYQMRTVLMNKFGFDNACFFQFILFKNVDILVPFFSNKSAQFVRKV